MLILMLQGGACRVQWLHPYMIRGPDGGSNRRGTGVVEVVEVTSRDGQYPSGIVTSGVTCNACTVLHCKM